MLTNRLALLRIINKMTSLILDELFNFHGVYQLDVSFNNYNKAQKLFSNLCLWNFL